MVRICANGEPDLSADRKMVEYEYEYEQEYEYEYEQEEDTGSA